MKRRAFISLGGAAAAVPWPSAAQAPRHARMGFLTGGHREQSAFSIDVMRESLSQLGWQIGDKLEIVGRWAGGDSASLPRLANELVALQPNVIVSTGITETKALQAATQTIPILFMQLASDPVAAGFVKSIARPGGNITGFMQGPQILWGKRIELISEMIGRPPRRLAWLGNPANNGSEANWGDALGAAARFGYELNRVNASSAKDIDRAFDGLKTRDGLLVQYDFMFTIERVRIAALAAQLRLPAIYENRIHPLFGGLMSYGGDLRENYRQGASYVHRVLNGASPGDLPVVQASRFELVLNLKTAKALGLAVPELLLTRADEIIE